MKQESVLNCMFQRWYPVFQHLSFKSEIIPLPDEFIDFLHADSLFVREDAFPNVQKHDRYDEGEDAWSDDESNDEKQTPPEFPALELEIEAAIARLGGEVFPKLNWSSPQDATWMSTGGTLKCRTPSDIFLLLKSSDFVAHDLSMPFANCDDASLSCPPGGYVLVLRKFYDLKPGMEFRCFVKNNSLLGVSQRDDSTNYPFLQDMASELREKIVQFFEANIRQRFFEDSFVFDVYVAKSMKIYLMDFNPFGPVTDSLLFSWEELLDVDATGEHSPEFRIVDEPGKIRPNVSMSYRLPFELKDFSSGSAIAEFLQNMQESQRSAPDVDALGAMSLSPRNNSNGSS